MCLEVEEETDIQQKETPWMTSIRGVLGLPTPSPESEESPESILTDACYECAVLDALQDNVRLHGAA